MKSRIPPSALIIVAMLVFVSGMFFFFHLTGIAETNIDSTNYWAWSDTTGWWDFYNTNMIQVGTSTLHGYASSSVGEMALNCDSSPGGNICGASDFAVTNSDGSGELSGCAWNDAIGWISFDCADYDCQGGDICTESNYQVAIDADGIFSGYAWNDIDGWISFNCSNNSTCSSSDYKVETSWRPGRLTGYLISSIVDTQETGGVTLTNIIWQGTQPSGTSVDFQMALSNSTGGPWTYAGPGGATDAWYGAECPTVGAADPAAGPSKSICVDKTLTKNQRYLRYKIRLQSNMNQNETPNIEDVILNWSE